MFGYVIPDRAGLSPEAQSRYRSAYCGLCRRIDALHGLRGRFSLSYDLTFLTFCCAACTRAKRPQTAASAAAPSTRYTVYFGAAPTLPTTAPT